MKLRFHLEKMVMKIVSRDTVLNIYKCYRCGKYYSSQTGGVIQSCAVLHHGGCCHYLEVEVSVNTLLKIKTLLEV